MRANRLTILRLFVFVKLALLGQLDQAVRTNNNRLWTSFSARPCLAAPDLEGALSLFDEAPAVAQRPKIWSRP